MSEQLTKQQLQEKYSKCAMLLGDRLYKISVPFMETCEILKDLLEVNREMGKLLKKEAEEQKDK